MSDVKSTLFDGHLVSVVFFSVKPGLVSSGCRLCVESCLSRISSAGGRRARLSSPGRGIARGEVTVQRRTPSLMRAMYLFASSWRRRGSPSLVLSCSHHDRFLQFCDEGALQFIFAMNVQTKINKLKPSNKSEEQTTWNMLKHRKASGFGPTQPWRRS